MSSEKKAVSAESFRRSGSLRGGWALLCLLVFLGAILLISGNAAFARTEGGGGIRPPSLEALRERIALLEKALASRTEGERMERGGDAIGALLAFKRSHTIYPDSLLERKIRGLTAGDPLSPRPDLQPLRARIALLEELLAGLDTLDDLFGPGDAPAAPAVPGDNSIAPVDTPVAPAGPSEIPAAPVGPGDTPALPADPGDTPAAPVGPVVAILPEEEFVASEDPDWKNYPDLPKEKTVIEESFDEFRRALKEGNIPQAVALIAEDRREEYTALFANRPEAMPSFAALLENAEMSFFSAAERADPATSSSLRTSEYAVVLDGFTFYIRWIKVNGKWVLFDF